MLCGLFKNIQGLSKSELIEKRYQSELTSCINKLNGSKAELKKHADALRTLQDEVVKAINGESKFDADTLNDLIKQTKEKVAAATTTVQQYESELENRHKHMANIQAQYNELISWADIFQNSPKGTKKMITAYLIDRVDVRCGYEVDIKFNVVYEQFCMAS